LGQLFSKTPFKKERHPRGDGVLSRVGLWTKEKGNYFSFYLLAKSGTIVSYADILEKRQEASKLIRQKCPQALIRVNCFFSRSIQHCDDTQ
jgi:hypothetical protein